MRRGERDELVEALRQAPPPFDREAFRDLVERRALDLREAFGSAPDECRHALGTLLAGERMRVLADTAAGFRVEGLFRLPLNADAPGAGDSGGIASGGSGGALRPSLPVPMPPGAARVVGRARAVGALSSGASE